MDMSSMSSSDNMTSMSSSDSISTMPMSMMQMVFYTSTTTPLYSMSWAPMNTGAYAGTCLFLIILAVVFRGLLVFKHTLEQRWSDRELNRRRVLVKGRSLEVDRDNENLDPKTGILVTKRGVEEKVRVIQRPVRTVAPWRFSVDLPRAALVTVTGGVMYLLMLGVMTMNVGYFMSILAGFFLGELIVGRYSQS